MELYWVTHDYLERMCSWLSVSISQILNNLSDQPFSLKGWRFRFVFNDELEQLKTDQLLTVFEKKRVAIFNVQPSIFTGNDYKKVWALSLLKEFFHIQDIDEAEELVFGDDATIPDMIYSISDPERVMQYREEAVYTIDYVIPFDITDKKENKNAEVFLDNTSSAADDAADFLPLPRRD